MAEQCKVKQETPTQQTPTSKRQHIVINTQQLFWQMPWNNPTSSATYNKTGHNITQCYWDLKVHHRPHKRPQLDSPVFWYVFNYMQLLSGHVTSFFCKNQTSIQKSANEVHPQFNPAALFTKKSSAVHFNIIFPSTALGHSHKKWRVPEHDVILTPAYLRSTGSLFYRLPSLGQQL